MMAGKGGGLMSTDLECGSELPWNGKSYGDSLAVVSVHPHGLFHFVVLQQTHAAFVHRISAMKLCKELPVKLTEETVAKLGSLLQELYDAIENDEDLHPILDRFLILVYSTSGNSCYLLLNP
jgi:hypothetical protein